MASRRESLSGARGRLGRNSGSEKTGRIQGGTQRRALLAGLNFGILVSLSGVRLLGPIFQIGSTEGVVFKEALFHFTDIIITAGLIAGGSSTIHE